MCNNETAEINGTVSYYNRFLDIIKQTSQTSINIVLATSKPIEKACYPLHISKDESSASNKVVKVRILKERQKSSKSLFLKESNGRPLDFAD